MMPPHAAGPRAAALAIATVLFAAAADSCSRSGTQRTDVLPGHHRPVLAHDWPRPQDYRFRPVTFLPPRTADAQLKTASGVRAFVISDLSDPVVRVTAAIPLGRYYERPGEAGASALLVHLLTRTPMPGAGRALSMELEELGTQIDSEELPDLTRLSLEVSSQHWREALDLLVRLVRRSSFDAGSIDSYRTPTGYSFPTSYVFEAGPVPSAPGEFRPKVELERAIAGYPLAPAEPGKTVSAEAVRDVARRALAANLVVFGIGGNVARDAVVQELGRLTAGWGAAPEPTANAPIGADTSSPASLFLVDVPTLEGWIAIGRVVAAIPTTDRAALEVCAEILSTRLNIAVREIRGLANRTVAIAPQTRSGAGLFHIRSGGRPEAVAPIVKFSLDEIRRMHSPEDAIGAAELTTAQGALVLGSWQTSLDGARSASTTFAVEAVRWNDADHFRTWPQAVNAVTAQQVKQIAAKYLDPARMQTVIVGPIGAIRRARHPRWPVDLDSLKPVVPSAAASR